MPFRSAICSATAAATAAISSGFVSAAAWSGAMPLATTGAVNTDARMQDSMATAGWNCAVPWRGKGGRGV